MSVCRMALMMCLRSSRQRPSSSLANRLTPSPASVRYIVARWWLSSTLVSLYKRASSCLVAIRKALLTPADSRG